MVKLTKHFRRTRKSKLREATASSIWGGVSPQAPNEKAKFDRKSGFYSFFLLEIRFHFWKLGRKATCGSNFHNKRFSLHATGLVARNKGKLP
jgi:hypothetical protein